MVFRSICTRSFGAKKIIVQGMHHTLFLRGLGLRFGMVLRASKVDQDHVGLTWVFLQGLHSSCSLDRNY